MTRMLSWEIHGRGQVAFARWRESRSWKRCPGGRTAAPIVVQSMTLTDTATRGATAQPMHRTRRGRIRIVRVTVTCPKRRPAVPEINSGCSTPGAPRRSSATSTTTATAADEVSPELRAGSPTDVPRDHNPATSAPARAATNISPRSAGRRSITASGAHRVNGGSLNQGARAAKMQENTDHDLGKSSKRSSTSAWCCRRSNPRRSRSHRSAQGPDHHFVQDVAAAGISSPSTARSARATEQPLHLASPSGMGTKGLVWSASAMGVLLNEGIGRHDSRFADGRARRRSP